MKFFMSNSVTTGQNWYLAPKIELFWFGQMKIQKMMGNFTVAIPMICSNTSGGILGPRNLAPMTQNLWCQEV